MLCMPHTLRPLLAHRSARYAVSGLIVVSVLVQVVGAFNFPCGWDSDPDTFTNPERLWDWGDTQIGRCLAAGPVYPDGLRFLTGNWPGSVR